MPAVILADSYYFNCSYDKNNNTNRLIHYIFMWKYDKIVNLDKGSLEEN